MKIINLASKFQEVIESRAKEIKSWDEDDRYWYEVGVAFRSDDSTKSVLASDTSTELLKYLMEGSWCKHSVDKNGNFIVYEDREEYKAKDAFIDVWRLDCEGVPELVKVLAL